MSRFGNRVRPYPGDPRRDVSVAPVSQNLIRASRNGWFDDPDEMFYMGYGMGGDGSVQGKKTWLYALENEGSVKPGGIYVEDEPAGYVLFSPLPERRIMGVTLWVHPAQRRQRVGSSALAQILNLLFARSVYRVETEVLRKDQRGNEFLKSFGMKREANRIRSLWMGRTAFDTTLWRVLQPDWHNRLDETYWKET